MTGNELLTYALGLMGEPSSSAADYSGYSLPAVNILLAECWQIENSIREAEGEETLTECPELANLEEEIPYNRRLIVGCLSYGLAAKLILEDNDMAKFNYFNGMYVQAQGQYQKAREESVVDLYPGWEE